MIKTIQLTNAKITIGSSGDDTEMVLWINGPDWQGKQSKGEAGEAWEVVTSVLLNDQELQELVSKLQHS